ncbi:MAG: Vgb family protein [Candidatus Nitrosotenuis sp.]
MKKRTQGLIVASFFAIILITSTLALALNSSPNQQNPLTKTTITGTPADNFPDLERPKFCGTGDAKSTQYVTEFKIPTDCTQPLAITTDDTGNVYFAQTNTGKIAKFDPNTENFVEYQNPDWPANGRSMIWGIDYSYDGNVWYTDDSFNSIWKFSTTDKKYERISFPTKEDALPQHLKVLGNQIIVNDFYESKISFFDTTQTAQDKTYTNIPSPLPGYFVGGFDVDLNGNIWYTNWLLRQGGALVKFDYDKFNEFVASDTGQNVTVLDFSQMFNLPQSIGAPNGLSADKNGNIWLADTASSSFYKFTESDESFTKYTTPDAPESTYGNVTGVIKIPITQPYWTQVEGDKLVFNEQAANSFAVFDIEHESLVEYHVPSKNPNWADCGDQPNCGIAQIFGFKAAGDKIWFTQWVENKIGKVDLAKPLSTTMSVSNKQITIPRGQTASVDMTINTNTSTEILSKATSEFSDIAVKISTTQISESQSIPVSIVTSQSALPGTYKVLLSARTADITVSEFVTVIITQ